MSITTFLKDYFKPEAGTVRTRDVIRELPTGVKKTTRGIGSFLVGSGQSFFRGTAGLGSLLGPTLTPRGPFLETLYGTNKPITLRSVGEEFGLKGIPATVAGLALPAADLIPGGKITKTAAINILKRENDFESVLKTMRQLMGVSDKVATKYAPQIAKTSDPQQLRVLIDQVVTESQSVQRIAKGAANALRGATTKERKFVTSAREVIPTANKLAGQYVPRSTDALAVKAAKFVEDDIVNAARFVREAPLGDRTVAVGSELIKKLGDNIAKETDLLKKQALEDQAATIANELARKLTEAGRTVQAASILGRLTPEGQLKFAAREIQLYNESNPTRRIPELSGEQSSYILKEAREIQQMPSGNEQALRWQRLQEYISDLTPTPLMKKILAIWKAGLLTGIKTSGLNLFSNLFHNVSEVVKDIPAVVVDSAAALFTGERTKTLTLRTAFEGMKEGSIKGVRYFSTGFDERNVGAKIDYKRVNFGKGAVAKVFQKYTDTVFRALAVGDQPFYYASLSRSLMDQALAVAKNEGLKGKAAVTRAYEIVESPTEEMLRTGVADAATSVFINETEMGKAARGLQKRFGGFGEFIIPFGRTPSAVAMQAIAYSPVGTVATLVRNIGKGRFNQRDFSQGIGRGLTGTALMYIGMELAKNKMVAPAYPVGDEKEQKLQEAVGVKNGYLLVGGKWRSPLVLGPAGIVVQAGGLLQQALDTEGSPTDAAAKAFATAGKAFLELPFLTGLEDAINALMSPDRYFKAYLPGLIASFVPTIVADIARAGDPVERRTSGPTIIDSVQARLKSRIPIVREGLEPKVNILGYPVERAGNVIEVMFDPSRPSQTMETPVTMEFRRLHEAGFRVTPTALGDKNGYKTLTAEQNTNLWQITGTLIDKKLTALFAHQSYSTLSDEDKAKVIADFVEKAKRDARATVVIELTTGLSGDALAKKLAELKGNVLTREVYDRYIELR